MPRPTTITIDTQALIHNIACVKRYAPEQLIIAMVKANAYGCGVAVVAPILEPFVAYFGVACLEEARLLRQFCPDKPCILLQGLSTPDELSEALALDLRAVIHDKQQLEWMTTKPLARPIKVWVKVDTGMHRLGFTPEIIPVVTQTLIDCPWIDSDMGLMTHLACAEEMDHPLTARQLAVWQQVVQSVGEHYALQSVANSASIIGLLHAHARWVRPGIMLYGASPFADQTGVALGLRPVMHFESAVMSIHQYDEGECIGYGATWCCPRPSIIGVVPVGYGDGYPRHISAQTPVWINGCNVPIVGRISMDMMTIDITDCPHVRIGDRVELWGTHIPIEVVANQANTIAYELLCQVTQRVIRHSK